MEQNINMIYTSPDSSRIQQAVTNHLRSLGVKSRLKRTPSSKTPKDCGKIKKVFNVLLSHQSTEPVKLTTGASVNVPKFVRQAVNYLDNHLDQEGLFRKAGSNSRLKELVSRIDNGIEIINEKNQPYDVANCLKKYFRDLPEPLIPYSYHDLFVRCGMLKIGKIDALLQACLLLPSRNLSTLAYFMDFLNKVSLNEKLNKMGNDNLAKVVGPNIMPLKETTMAAVQTRLEAHLKIITILIENAKRIGAVPKFIVDSLSFESTGNIDSELDSLTAPSLLKHKKKKNRSGSLTRMFNGLKKIVGNKNGSPEYNNNNNGLNRTSVDSQLSLVSPTTTKQTKKRKIIETITNNNQLKKKRDSLSANGSTRVVLLSPVSNNPNPTDHQKSHHKIERIRKLGINIDRFVSKSRQKINYDDNNDNNLNKLSPMIERRWSMAGGPSKLIKKRTFKKSSVSSLLETTKIQSQLDECSLQTLNEDYAMMLTGSEINLSDDDDNDFDQSVVNNLLTNKTISQSRRSSRRHQQIVYNEMLPTPLPSSASSLSSSFSSLSSSAIPVATSSTTSIKNTGQNNPDTYVKLRKSEYDNFIHLVSTIESTIHNLECQSTTNNNNNNNNDDDNYPIDEASQVQSKYEQTLDEANIEKTTSTDQLAKRLSRELKIRRSIENKIIRSPSARRIGVIRRRSQEKTPSRRNKINRTPPSSSWHISDESQDDNNLLKTPENNNNSYCNNERIDYEFNENNNCINETNSRINDVHKRLSTLMSHTAEHTRSSTNYNEMINDIVKKSPNNNTTITKKSSAFNDNETAEYKKAAFNNKMKNLKKNNNNQHKSVLSINNNYNNSTDNNKLQVVDEEGNKLIWKNASIYFETDKQSSSVNKKYSPSIVSQTSRASIAKLRTQNAGMVLAKARLFDDNDMHKTVNESSIGERQRKKNNSQLNSRESRVSVSPGINLTNSARKKKIKSPKNIDGKYKMSPLTIHHHQTPSIVDQENSRRENNLLSIPPTNELNLSRDIDTVNLIKTPHIKKPLTMKTPKSARSIVRRATIDTRRTPLKATPLAGTPKRQSPRNAFKSRIVARNII